MVSIKDVASKAGVAVSTVSKVLNNYPNVTKATKDKVNEAIAELGFVPNAVAAALSSKQSTRVAILMNQSSQSQAIDEIDMQYLSGAIVKARKLGLDVITLFFSMLKDKSSEEIISYLRSQSITGLVIYGTSKNDREILKLAQCGGFKTVFVDAPIVNENTSCVWIDQKKAQYDVAHTLLEINGAKKMLYLAGKKNGFVTLPRIEGIKSLCAEKDIELTIRYGNFNERTAREIAFESAREFDIIVCASDLMAIGVMRALTEMDVFRPVCGFDGITLMGYAGKQMYTVKQDFSKISENAFEEVYRLLKGEQGREMILPHKVLQIKYSDVLCQPKGV